MGTVGPGSIHLLNGLYDAKKSRAPVLAICGQVPTSEIGSEFFQEVNNDVLFADVAVFARSVTSANQMPHVLEQAVNAAMAQRGVAVLTIPGDVGSIELSGDVPVPQFAPGAAPAPAPQPQVEAAAKALNDGKKVTLLVGMGAREARHEVLDLAETLQAPMVLKLKGKEGLEAQNSYQVGQTGLIGNPAAVQALDDADVVFMIGTDFPYRDWYPEGKIVLQLDSRGENIGRRTHVMHALRGDAGLTLRSLRPLLHDRTDAEHLEAAQKRYAQWCEGQTKLTRSGHDKGLLGKLRSKVDNPEKLIRPEKLAAALDRYAARDAIFTADTGMSTVWLSRFIKMSDERRLLGSYNLGSMANAMPQALGSQILDRSRQVIACGGDGGLMMLLGDLRTAVTYELPVKIVVFNNGRLGMVKLEQEQGGLPEFGTPLDNPDLADVARAMGLTAIQITDPEDLEESVRQGLDTPGPVLIDVLTNPDEISVPPKVSGAQAWGFAIAKSKEFIESR